MKVCTLYPCGMTSDGYCSICNPRPVYAPNPDPFRLGAVPLPMGQQLGCICPPTSEQTCQSPICPRKNHLKAAGPAVNSQHGAGEVKS